jgi:hypothetical protein
VPFLRFSRDRRGYENTFLLHGSRKRGDQDRPQLLYWFRTPPHVKVGRAAFDEDAIRALEGCHPEVEFDWPSILETRPPLPGLEEPEPSQPPRRSSVAVPGTERPEPEPEPEASPEVSITPPEPTVVNRALTASGEASVPAAIAGRRFVRVFDTGDPALEPAPAHHLSDPSAAERLLGSEQLALIRGQYAALLARIDSRITDQARLDALRQLAERVNPDNWVTEDDVRAGLAGLEASRDEILRQVGRRRRRRRRGRQQPHSVDHLLDSASTIQGVAESRDEGHGEGLGVADFSPPGTAGEEGEEDR